MAAQFAFGYCKNCGTDQFVTVQRKGTNNGLHLLLILVTGGAWILGWALFNIFGNGPWRCGQCGYKAKRAWGH